MRQTFNRVLFATSALAAMTVAGSAMAQAAGGNNQLEEVVVTATRQTDTVNRVPLSISATTQKSMDQRGIANVTDLQARVPALTVSGQSSPAVAQITIRGIQNTGAGAATTGFYLDDTPLTKRGASGGVGTINGSPIPPLFDLERIEVLRGPQGTLYGGSSEGGTIRFITPPPSLTRYSTYIRGQVSQYKDGGTGFEGGVAVGGPIIQDKLGFRVSAFARKDAGYIDEVNQTGQTEMSNVNDRKVSGFRGALMWAPTENARVTLSYFYSRDKSADIQSQTSASTGAINIPSLTYNYTNPGPGPCGTVGGNIPVIPRPVAVNGIAIAGPAPNCATPGQVPGTPYTGPVSFTRPGVNLAALNFGADDKFFRSQPFPANTVTRVPTLTLEYNFPTMTVKSITSYIQDTSYNVTSDSQSQLIFSLQNATNGGALIPNGLFIAGPALPYPAERDIGRFYANNKHYGVTQEIRFSSANPASPLTWVGGVFYSNSRIHNTYENIYSPTLTAFTQALYGLTAKQQYGSDGFIPAGQTTASGFDHKDQTLKDVEVAAFGEATYKVTEKLKLTAGLRYSRQSFDFNQSFFGPINGFNVPTVANQGLASGSTTESPLTPKAGLQYNLSDSNMVYLTASKGFRAGGVNTLLPLAICGRGLSTYGLTPQDVPSQYKSDTVWNYEGGAKLRLLEGRAQVNAAVYRIDWSDVQITASPGSGCGIPFTTNAGTARSQGFEFEGNLRVGRNFTLNAGIAYDDAKFTQDSPSIAPKAGFPTLILAYKDQKFDIAPWTFDIGARFDQEIATGVNLYARVDTRYATKRKNTLRQLPAIVNGVVTNASWSPDYIAHDYTSTNMRLGIERGAFDINLFVNNVFNKVKGDLVNTAGRASCTNATCSTYGFNYTPLDYQYFAPRQIGIQIAYRH